MHNFCSWLSTKLKPGNLSNFSSPCPINNRPADGGIKDSLLKVVKCFDFLALNRYIAKEMPGLLQAEPGVLVVPPTFPDECPVQENKLKVKGWKSEKMFFDSMTSALKTYQEKQKTLSIVYFHGLQYGRCTDDGQGNISREEYEADAAIFMMDLSTGNPTNRLVCIWIHALWPFQCIG